MKLKFEISNKTLGRIGIAAAIILVLVIYSLVSFRQGNFNQSVQTRIKGVSDSTSTTRKIVNQTQTAFNNFCTQYNVSQKVINDSLGNIVALAKGNGSDLTNKWSWVVKSILSIEATQKDQQKRVNALTELWKDNVAKFFPPSGGPPATNNPVKSDTTKKAVGPIPFVIDPSLNPAPNISKSDSTSVTTSDKKKKKKSFTLKNLFKSSGSKASGNKVDGPFWGPK
jgi:uncharacterized protein (UPF0335 family)